MTATPADHAFAWHLAVEAGEMLLRLRQRLNGTGADSKTIGDEGDRMSHMYLSQMLRSAYPSDAVLSEEGADNPARLDHRRVWIVDPLDGTREFGEGDRSDWAVHVALAIDGQLCAGVVSLPARGLALASWPPAAAVPRMPGPVRILVSRTRPPQVASDLAAQLQGDLVPLGSAGAKMAAVLLGEADIYVHAGGQWEWDSAAPVAVAWGAGLHASRIDGSPLTYNQRRPWLPDLLICRPHDAVRALAALKGTAVGVGPD